MMRCRCVIQVINYVLDRSDSKKQIMRMIQKVENTFKYKYNQSNMINDITSNKIKTNLEIIIVILSVALTQRSKT